MTEAKTLVIGSRGSDLALWQSRWVAARLGLPSKIVVIQTKGDRILDRDLSGIEGKGFFTKELEDALYDKSTDLAVHSLKDLPTQTPPGLVISAICERVPAADLLLVHPDWHAPGKAFPVKPGGQVGASSLRRQSLLKALAPDLEPASLRGNVPTRIRKLREGGYAAIVIAEAGVSRLDLDLSPLLAYRLNPEWWLPAPGQGALGIETRQNDYAEQAVKVVHHENTRVATDIERGLLARFEGGCHLPLGAWARPLSSGSPEATESPGASEASVSSESTEDPESSRNLTPSESSTHFRLIATLERTAGRVVRCDVQGEASELVALAHQRLIELDEAAEALSFKGSDLCEPLFG